MIRIRKSEDRGRFQFGWLDTRHTFSFGEYYDPQHLGFSALRVINEDDVAPGTGFPTHGHKDMEIVTYILRGALEHKDSLGNGSIIRPGEVQRMTAGSGIQHSERNPSADEAVKLLQIWIFPDRKNLAPGYEQTAFLPAERRGKLRLVGSSDGREGSVTIHQDVSLYASLLKTGERVEHMLAPGRMAWIQVADGAVKVNGMSLAQGDGAAVNKEASLVIEAVTDTEILLFDLPPVA